MKYIKAYEFSENELFAEEIPIWFPDCPFGHLEEKYSLLLTKFNILNDTIREILELDQKIKDAHKEKEYIPRETSRKSTILKMRFSSEIKMYTDELISIHSILYKRKIDGVWPEQIKPDSIAEIITNINKFDYEIYKPFEGLLKLINGLGNAVKHSFINTEVIWYRSYTPESYLIGFYNKYNNIRRNGIESFEIKLLDFINQYNLFLQKMKNELKNNFNKFS